MKDKNGNKLLIIRKGLKVCMAFSFVLGVVFVICGLVTLVDGISHSSDRIALAENANLKRAGQISVASEEAIYTLEARVIDDNDSENMWYHDVIAVSFGQKIEVRLKAFSAHPENVEREAVYHNGLSITHASSLKVLDYFRRGYVLLPDGSKSDYLENTYNDNVQYYSLGTYQLSLSAWLLRNQPDATLSAFNSDGPSATLQVVAEYGAFNVRLFIGYLVLFVLFGLMLPRLIDKADAKVVDEYLASMQ